MRRKQKHPECPSRGSLPPRGPRTIPLRQRVRPSLVAEVGNWTARQSLGREPGAEGQAHPAPIERKPTALHCCDQEAYQLTGEDCDDDGEWSALLKQG